MSQDDPFRSPSNERTVMKPSPGGRTAMAGAMPAGAPSLGPLEPLEPVAATGLNPLVAAANPLLMAVPQLRATLNHPNPAALRDQLAGAIRVFESRAKASGVASEKVIAARYALCTLLDEAAASTPWGGQGSWAKHSLLVLFHNEAWGGEKFFELLSKLAENPAGNRDLLELMYTCLALGFEGRYRVAQNGRTQLDSLRERLAQILRQQPGEYERDLAPRWQGVVPKGRSIFAMVPLWIGVALCGLLLLAVYLGLSYVLNTASDPVYAELQSIRVQTPTPREPAPAVPAASRGSGSSSPERSRKVCRRPGRAPSERGHAARRRRLRGGQRERRGAATAGPAARRRRAERCAGHGPRHRAHRQPADPFGALSVELAPVARARTHRRGPAGEPRGPGAASRRGPCGCRAARAERHAGQPRAQPTRRNHLVPGRRRRPASRVRSD